MEAVMLAAACSVMFVLTLLSYPACAPASMLSA
jgi:hypothetical protein